MDTPARSLSLAALLVLTSLGCADQESAPRGSTPADTLAAHEIAVGEQFIVELHATAGTGYQWEPVAVPAALVQVGDASFACDVIHDGPWVGCGGTATFTFEAVDAGEGTLRLEYFRPWETSPPADTFETTVRVE